MGYNTKGLQDYLGFGGATTPHITDERELENVIEEGLGMVSRFGLSRFYYQ